MLKNSSDIWPSKSEFQNQCGNEAEASSSGSCPNSYVNLIFKNCSNNKNFPPGLPRQRLNGLTFGKNESSRFDPACNKNNETSLAPLDGYIVCGYARRKKGHCRSKNTETQCSRQKISKNAIDTPSKVKVCIADSGKRQSQSENAKLSGDCSKVNIKDSCKKISETKLDNSCRSCSSSCTDYTGGYVSKITSEEDLCRRGSNSDKDVCSSCESHTESSYGTKMKGLCPNDSIEKIPCECPLNPARINSHATKPDDCSKTAVPIKGEPSCSHWGHSISSKIPTRPLYSSTICKAPRKHNLRKRHQKHSCYSRLGRRDSRKSPASSCNWRKEIEGKAKSNCSMEHRKRKPRNYDKITAKAICLFERDLKEKSPNEVNVQSKFNGLPSHRKFYYFWLALGNEPLSEDPYENYIKFTKQQCNGSVSLEDLEGWSCLPYSKRMFFFTESLLAKLFSTKIAPSDKFYQEYFSSTYKKYSQSHAILTKNLTLDSEDSSGGHDTKILKYETSSCSF